VKPLYSTFAWMYLNICSSQIFGHSITILGYLLWFARLNTTLKSWWHCSHLVCLWGHFFSWTLISHLQIWTEQPRFVHFTIFIPQFLEWLSAVSNGPVQSHPIPSSSKELGHLIVNFCIMACTARLRDGSQTPNNSYIQGRSCFQCLLHGLGTCYIM